jgi:hypothetical protein
MIKKCYKNILLTVAFLAVPFFVLAEGSGADFNDPAESVGIALNGSVFSFDADPGQLIDLKITVENIRQSEQKVSIYAEDLLIEDNNRVTVLSENNEVRGMKDWVKLGEADLVLVAGEKKEETVSVLVPEKATVGSHYAGIFFQSFPAVDVNNFQKTIVSGRVGAYIMINVRGEISAKGNLSSFKSPIVAGKSEKFTAEFENMGNVHYIPHGEIQVRNLITKNEKTLEVPKHFVFPGKKYSFDVNWNPESVLGAYRAKAYFVDGEKNVHATEKFIFGKLFFVWPSAVVIIFILGFRTFRKQRVK